MCAGSLLLLALGATPASAALGGFEGKDGNQTCNDDTPTQGIDWGCFTSVTGTAIDGVTDGTGTSDDTVSGKDDTPGGWLITMGATGGSKTDITNVWRSSTEASPGRSFLNLALKRVGGAPSNGNFVFELNQKRTTFVNLGGTTVPCRTNGDVLVSYDLGSSATVGLSKWVGTPSAGDPVDGSCPGGATGTWLAAPASATTYEAGVNGGAIANALPGATGPFTAGTFGEASLDIAGIAGDLTFTRPCELFTGLQARSRSSSSTSSNLGDIVASTKISVAGCAPPGGGGGTPAPSAPTIAGGTACVTTSTVTLSGTAEKDAQVLISDHGQTVGIATADAAGAWTTDVPAVADGNHSYSAVAVNAGGTSPSSGAVAVLVDSTADAATTILTPAAGSTVGGGALNVGGTAEPGTTVTLTDGGASAGTAITAADGTWTITIAAPAVGSHVLTATAGDDCNAGATAATRAYTVSRTPGGGDEPGGDNTSGGGGNAAGGGTGAPGSPLSSYGVAGVTVGCATRRFSSYVDDKKHLLARVVFKVDGKVVGTVRRRDRQGRMLLIINPTKYTVGAHKLTLTLVPKSKRLKSRTISKPFKRCSVCTSRRSFRIQLKQVHGEKLRSAKIYVNGKHAKVYKGKRLRSRVTLTGLPQGIYKVRIRVVTVSGKVASSTRTYRTCTLGKPVKKQ